jgi:hypothetical protein
MKGEQPAAAPSPSWLVTQTAEALGTERVPDWRRWRHGGGSGSRMRASGVAPPPISYAALKEWRADCAVEKHLLKSRHAQRMAVVRRPQLLTRKEVAAVHQLYEALRGELRVHTRDASGEKRVLDSPHEAWHVCYLNQDGHFARALPQVRLKLIAAAREASATHWGGVLEAATEPLVPRCVEYHTVRPPGSLPTADHYDHGSFVTVDVMLSERGDFEGGTFQTLEPDGQLASHDFGDAGDALVFLSHKPHCVAPVESGTRHVLIVELWEGIERDCGHRCGMHWAPCDFR